MEAIRNEENMQQLKKVQKLIIGMGEALLCYGAEISRVEETIQRVADHFQIEEVEMYVITNGLFVNVHQQEEHTSTRLKYVPSISVNMKKLCDINELSRRIEQGKSIGGYGVEDAGTDSGGEKRAGVGTGAFLRCWCSCFWFPVWRKHVGLSGCFCVRCDLADVFLFLRGEACQYFKGLARYYRWTACHDSLCDPAADRCVGTFGTGDRRGDHSDDSRSGIYQRNT